METFPILMFRLHSRWLSLSGAAKLTLPLVLEQGVHSRLLPGGTGMLRAQAQRQCNTVAFTSMPTAVSLYWPGGGDACANSTVHKKQEKTEDFTIKQLCVCIL